jgi:hypothetical protein
MAFVQVPLFSNNDAADDERLNAVISNLNYLNQSKVKVRYNAYGVIQTDNIKIACGVISCDNPNGVSRTRWISTGNFFTPGTRPVAVASLSTDSHTRAFLTIRHRTGQGTILDHTGFQARARNSLTSNLVGPNYVNWIMMGY